MSVPMFSLAAPFAARWAVLSLARRYLVIGAGVMLAGMVAIGAWVSHEVAAGVTRNSAVTTALYVDSVIAPILSSFKSDEVLSAGAQRALDEVLTRGALGERIASFKIWGRGGFVAYASEPALIGQRFEPADDLRTAWGGTVAASFDDLADDEDALEREANEPLLEIYNPIRAPWSGEVIAVAEFYERADELQADLAAVRMKTGLTVAAATLAMMGALFGVVLGGSRTIVRQQATLKGRVVELQTLLAENADLHRRIREASSGVAARHELMLRQASADLHDGPAQLLALAAMRLGSVARGREDPEIGAIRGFLDEALQEIRAICQGLALPKIETLSLPELLAAVARTHEGRTRTSVALTLGDGLPEIGVAAKIGVYRFVQEGLTNAFRHAGGKGQRVSAEAVPGAVRVAVGDEGPGIGRERVFERLGLSGMRDRVESLGGSLEIRSGAGGTELVMILPTHAGDL